MTCMPPYIPTAHFNSERAVGFLGGAWFGIFVTIGVILMVSAYMDWKNK